jgi:hypothetical protein
MALATMLNMLCSFILKRVFIILLILCKVSHKFLFMQEKICLMIFKLIIH